MYLFILSYYDFDLSIVLFPQIEPWRKTVTAKRWSFCGTVAWDHLKMAVGYPKDRTMGTCFIFTRVPLLGKCVK